MNQQRHRRAQALFEAAIDLPVAEQAAFVSHECGSDAELKRRLEDLLSAAARSTAHYLRKPLGVPGQLSSDTMITPPPLVTLNELGNGGNLLLSPVASEPQFIPGTCIYQYELIRELGRGGMGTVYLARDIRLGRRVAIKFLQCDRSTFTGRFIAEAQHTARCSHENIVVIHDVSEYQGAPFMVLEYLKGQPLSKLMAKGKIPPSRALQLMIPVVRALVFAHHQQIIHRDLKPPNVFITDSGRVKVLDFGIAKYVFQRQQREWTDQVATTVETVPQLPELTSHGAIIGTLPYMSPEQWGADKIDFRSDIWSVGIMLYHMVVGKHPLAPLRREQLMVTAILEQPMPSAHDARTDMPPELADIIDGCLKKHKSERIASADALLTALENLLPERHQARLEADQSPYAGLAAFQEADSGRFFGRSHDIATMLARLHDEPLIGVVGPSGVGKSSFVRAGLIPALKHSGEEWESFVIRPGREPLAMLARLIATIMGDESDEATWHAEDLNHHYDIIRRLTQEPGYLGAILRSRSRKHGRKIILFIDQFEELYTLTPDFNQRLAFTNALTGVADDVTSPLRVVLSIRSDFLDRVAEDRQFMAELNKALYFLVQPDRESLREAIVRPAEMLGYRFEVPWVVDHMLDRLEATAGALPLLQFAATKLWDNRNIAQKLLTERSYRELGGVEGALASHANAVLNSLSPKEQTLVRAVFLQLVTLERTRAIIPISELHELWDEPGVVQGLINILVDARLLVTNTGDSDTGALVEIVHESLIHSWPMLSHWLDENAEDAPYLEQLKAAAKQWESKGRPNGLLWRGEAAMEAETWYRRFRGFLPRLQHEYIQQVVALGARTAKRKRILVAGTIVFLSLLVIAAAAALVLIHDAEQNARRAEQTALKAYDDLKAETAAKLAAQGKVTKLRGEVGEKDKQVKSSREDLAEANEKLEATNDKLEASLIDATLAKGDAEKESAKARKAQRAAEQAQRAAEQAQRAAERAQAALNLELEAKEQKLRVAEQRVQELEKRLGKIRDLRE